MTSVVIDASALLALLFSESGAEQVESRLNDAMVSAVNYAEILSRVVDRGKDLQDAITQIGRLHLSHWPFDAEQAAMAAALRKSTRSRGLSIGDRACLALAMTHQVPVLTADREWTGLDIGVTINLIR